MAEIHMMTMDDLHEEMRGGRYWRGEAKRYEALWRASLRDGSFAADHAKGAVIVTFKWLHGPEDQTGRTLHSDEAERLTRDIGQASVLGALTSGEASVTITVRRKEEKA